MVHDHALYLASRGHRVHIVASKPGPGSVERDGSITIHRLPQVNHPVVRYYAKGLRRPYPHFDAHCLQVLPLLLRENFDLVHLFVYHHGPAVRLLHRLRGTPWVYHLIFVLPADAPQWDHTLLRRCLQSGVPIRVFSRYCADHVARHFGAPSHVIPPTVDTATFRPLGGKDLSRPKILFTADLAEPRKGADLLVRAFNHVWRARPDAVLQLAGPASAGPSGVKALLALAGPGARAAIAVPEAGALANVPRLYSEAAVTVLPSLDEAFGMVLTESLACGTPVVGSDSGALPEIVGDPAVGAIFARTADDEESARNLAAAVLRTLALAEDPRTSLRCADSARRWTWQAVGPAFDAFQEAGVRRCGPGEGGVRAAG